MLPLLYPERALVRKRVGDSIVKTPKSFKGWGNLLYITATIAFIAVYATSQFDQPASAQAVTQVNKANDNWVLTNIKKLPVWSSQLIKELPKETNVFFWFGFYIVGSSSFDWLLRKAGISQRDDH